MTSEQQLIAELPAGFQVVGAKDAPLALALKAQFDLIEEGAFGDAAKLNRAINTRLELLAIAEVK
jgi:hypothetical protein